MISHLTSAELMNTAARHFNASLDLDEVLGKVLRLTVEATDARRGSLFLLDEEGNVTKHILARPHQSLEVSHRTVQEVMAHGLAGWVYQHQCAALVANTATDERWVRLPNDEAITGSALVVPMLYQERVNGLLALHHEQINFFDESHLSLVTGIAGQAAIAMENARLFTHIKNEHGSLYALIRGIPIPVLVINAAEQIAFANQAAQELLALRQVGIPLQTIEAGERIKAALARLRQQPEHQSLEVSWPDKRVFNVSINKVPRLGTVVTLHDITYLKELDAMKSLFVETVSHDLKNPLTVIKGFAMLLEGENLSEWGRANLLSILQSADQMQELINNLLDLAQIEAGIDGQVEPCDLAQIAQEVLANFELQFTEKEIDLTTHLPAGLPKVSGRPLRLAQIVRNLVSNAIKYSPREGQVFVEVSQEGPEIRLRVTDNGPGISPADQSQLFQKFYRIPTLQESEWIEGSGLGLSIVKAIVEGYGGRVWVESKVGAGSTFGCALPVLNTHD